jgi:hypothetical protein
MRKFLSVLAALALLLGAGFMSRDYLRQAEASVSCSVPFNLTNGTTADASQVMANYNAIIACLGNAAAAGANTDITALLGLTTPLSPMEGGANTFLGISPTVSGSEIVIASTTPSGFANTQNYSVIFISPLNNSGALTLSVNGQTPENIYKQSQSGPVALSGGELVNGQIVWATFDGTEFQINPVPNVAAGWGIALAPTTSAIQINTTNPPYGFGPCVNMTIIAVGASPSAGLLTVALKAADTGLDPTASHPIICNWRDTPLTNGDPVFITDVTPTSINTNATGATLGTTNNTPFRFWIVLFNNGVGVPPVLALFNAATVSPTSISGLDESSLQSTTGIGAASTSSGVFYTPNGTALSSKAFRILGYLEYSSGLSPAGTYPTAPTKLQLFGPGIRKPGEIVQSFFSNITTGTNDTSGSYVTGGSVNLTITPTSAANLVYAFGSPSVLGTSGSTSQAQLFRATSGGAGYACTTPLGVPTIAATNGTHPQAIGPVQVYDAPGTTTAQTYGMCLLLVVGASNQWGPTALRIDEIQE